MFRSSDHQSNSLDEQTFRSMYGILQGGMWLLNDLENYLRPFEMSQGRLSILLNILDSPAGNIHPAEIATMTGKSRPTISKMINRLVEDGYVRDLPDTDGRIRNLEITEKGHSLLTSIVPGYNQRVRQMTKKLSSNDKKKLIEILSKIDFLDSDKSLRI